ncbi:hypothetical protein Bbelb_398570 [Branchiostoma belcheri]|nr:hypothetical protein Bbelb_398570 [Branchiostoma belcheri]
MDREHLGWAISSDESHCRHPCGNFHTLLWPTFMLISHSPQIFTVTNAKCHGGGNLLATSHGRKTSQTCSNTAGANWTSHQKSFLNISAHDIDLPLARPVGQTCQQATSTDTTTNNPGLASHVCGKGPGKLSAGNTADLGNFLAPCTNVVTRRRNDISAGQNRRRH